MANLDDLLQIGNAIRVHYGENNPNNETRHIRAIVDGNQIVYRVWSKLKQRWIYHITSRYEFELMQKYLEKAKQHELSHFLPLDWNR